MPALKIINDYILSLFFIKQVDWHVVNEYGCLDQCLYLCPLSPPLVSSFLMNPESHVKRNIVSVIEITLFRVAREIFGIGLFHEIKISLG